MVTGNDFWLHCVFLKYTRLEPLELGLMKGIGLEGVDFLMVSALPMKFVLKTLGKSDVILRPRSVESNPNKFANLTNAVGPILEMAPRVVQVI